MNTPIDPSVLARFQAEIGSSRKKILALLDSARDVTFLRGYGNIGDHLIYAGTRQLLRDVDYREISVRDLDRDAGGHTALLSGSGGWCAPYRDMPGFLGLAEERFERVIVLPSSYDMSIDIVRDSITRSKAYFFARERESFRQIRDHCQADLSHDCAFFFDFEPYRRRGFGTLNAFRIDLEAAYRDVPHDNVDLSNTCESLDELIWTVARHEAIRTDRAHVLIPALILGKRVEYRASSYHKVPGIVEFAFQGFPVQEMSEAGSQSDGNDMLMPTEPTGRLGSGRYIWGERVRAAARDIGRLTRSGAPVVLAADGQIIEFDRDHEWIPFLERNGRYWDAPKNEDVAIRELERLRGLGAEFFVIAWPAFWWSEIYPSFMSHVRANYANVASNDNLMIFELAK